MMVPELDGVGSGVECGAVLRFVMRDMGNGVRRLEDPTLLRQEWQDPGPDVLPHSLRFGDPLPAAVLDLAQTALLVLRDKALGYVLSAPVRGFAVFINEGVTQVTLKLSCVMGSIDLTAALVLIA